MERGDFRGSIGPATGHDEDVLRGLEGARDRPKKCHGDQWLECGVNDQTGLINKSRSIHFGRLELFFWNCLECGEIYQTSRTGAGPDRGNHAREHAEKRVLRPIFGVRNANRGKKAVHHSIGGKKLFPEHKDRSARQERREVINRSEEDFVPGGQMEEIGQKDWRCEPGCEHPKGEMQRRQHGGPKARVEKDIGKIIDAHKAGLEQQLVIQESHHSAPGQRNVVPHQG